MVITPYNLETQTINGLRHYVTPDGKVYPSVTSVVGYRTSRDLTEWKKSPVNQLKSERATIIGEYCHGLVESIAKSEKIADFSNAPTEIKNVVWNIHHGISSYFENHIDEVLLSESCLWSDKLQLAGRIDLLVRTTGGVLTILDFKFPAESKDEMYIQSYFHQATAYAIMIQERYQLFPKKIEIVVCPWKTLGFEIFNKDPMNYLNALAESIRFYRSSVGHAH